MNEDHFDRRRSRAIQSIVSDNLDRLTKIVTDQKSSQWTDVDGFPLVFFCVVSHAHTCLNYLLKLGADIHSELPNKEYLIHTAITCENEFALRQFLILGLDPNVPSTNEQNSPLHYAHIRGNESFIRLLEDCGADTRKRNAKGTLPRDINREDNR